MKKTKKYLPFGYKLMLSYLVFTIFIISLIGYVANSIYTKSIREQTRVNLNGTLTQMKDNVNYKLEDVRRISDMLYLDNTLGRHLRHYEEGWVSYSATTKYLIPKLSSTVEATNRKLWMSIFLHNESIPEIYSDYTDKDPLHSKMSLFDLYHMRRIVDKDWYREFPEEQFGKTLQWKQIEDDAKFQRISLLRRLIDSSGPITLPEIGFMRISISLDDLLESVDYQTIGDGTMLAIINEANELIMMSSDAEWSPTAKWSLEELEKGHLVMQTELPDLHWQLVALVPLRILEEDMNKVRTVIMYISVLCGVAFLLAGALISRYFSRKVSKIVSVLGSFQEGVFHKRIFFKGNDEFTTISGALNEMGQNIGELIRKVYVADLEKKEAELEMLQAQINPHFLYNTLSSLHRLSKFGENEKLQRVVLDLAKFYRLSLNDGRVFIPIASELEQAEAYINIQKIKYEERMHVHYRIDPQIHQYDTIKLIIQPFVENILEHAWRGDQVHIRIHGYLEEEAVIFKIIDDGVGIHPELLRQIQQPSEGMGVGYGIRNVHQRIQLYYGSQYGVRIHSRLGMGTAIIITIPTRQSREEQPYGQQSNSGTESS